MKAYIPSFSEIKPNNYELRENILITSWDKIVLTAMQF
jgi:hypothetical protein